MAFLVKEEWFLPKQIKLALCLLFLSAFVAAIGTYLDMSYFSEDGSYNQYIYLVDIFWLAIICWIAWDLGKKRKDVRLTIMLVGIIIIGFNVWNYVEMGISHGLYAYSLETVIYALVLILLSKKLSKEWYTKEHS